MAEQLVALSRLNGCQDLLDRLFNAMYRIAITKDELLLPKLEHLLWENFDALKRSLVLLPRIASGNIIRDDVR